MADQEEKKVEGVQREPHYLRRVTRPEMDAVARATGTVALFMDAYTQIQVLLDDVLPQVEAIPGVSQKDVQDAREAVASMVASRLFAKILMMYGGIGLTKIETDEAPEGGHPVPAREAQKVMMKDITTLAEFCGGQSGLPDVGPMLTSLLEAAKDFDVTAVRLEAEEELKKQAARQERKPFSVRSIPGVQ